MEPYMYSLNPINCPVNEFYQFSNNVDHISESNGAIKIKADNTERTI